MTADLDNLVGRYLEGSAGPEDVRQLDEAVRRDRAAGREVLLAAAMEVHLRRVLGVAGAGPATGPADEPAAAAPGPAVRAPAARPHRRWVRAAAMAAAVLAFLAGGVVASHYLVRAFWPDDGPRPAALVEAPKPAPVAPPAPRPAPVPEPAPPEFIEPPAPPVPEVPPPAEVRLAQVVETKGLVRMIPPDTGVPVTVAGGALVRPGARFWTCPWGGCSIQYQDGLTVGLNRSTIARLAQAGGAPRIDVQQGRVTVKGEARPAARDVVLASLQAEATLAGGDVFFSVQDGATVIEVADGTVELVRTEDQKRITVAKGQYAVVKPGLELRSRDGRFRWRLEPAQKVPDPGGPRETPAPDAPPGPADRQEGQP